MSEARKRLATALMETRSMIGRGDGGDLDDARPEIQEMAYSLADTAIHELKPLTPEQRYAVYLLCRFQSKIGGDEWVEFATDLLRDLGSQDPKDHTAFLEALEKDQEQFGWDSTVDDEVK